MIHRFMLPDSAATLLMLLGVATVVVYIVTSIAEIKEYRRERTIREFMLAVENNRISPTLAGYYRAAADGDSDDRDYWSETAEMFQRKNPSEKSQEEKFGVDITLKDLQIKVNSHKAKFTDC